MEIDFPCQLGEGKSVQCLDVLISARPDTIFDLRPP